MNELPYMPCSTLKDELDLAVQEERYEDAAYLHGLIEAGVRPGQIVGLWLPRGLDLLTMQLGIAKTGAAWLPFDAETPPERIAICLEDAHAAGLVVDAAGVDRVADLLAAQGASPPWTAEFLAAPTATPGPRRLARDART